MMKLVRLMSLMLIPAANAYLDVHVYTADSQSSTDESEDGTADQEASQERAESPHEHSESLFAESQVSVLEAYIMVFQYALRHHLTAKAFSELLLLLQVLLPADNLLPKSLYLLKNCCWSSTTNFQNSTVYTGQYDSIY